MNILVSADLPLQEFEKLCDKWDEESNVSLHLESKVANGNDVIALFNLVLPLYHRELAKAVIDAIAEVESTPDEILEKILDLSDTAAIESVCLREGLSQGLIKKCKGLNLTHRRQI